MKKSIKFGAWLNEWFEVYKKPCLKPYSLRNIEQMIRLHTPDWLKAKSLPAITAYDIDKALSSMPRGRTAIYARQVWHSALLKAEKLGFVDKNVVSSSDTVKYRKQSGRALTVAEQREFIKALDGNRYKWLMLFYLLTGVRRSEALSLRWEDIDEQEDLILIRGTKTASSFRHIILTTEVKAVLYAQRENVGDSPYVFPYNSETVSRAFKKCCPAHHLHDLRHTFITRCAESGMNVSVCQQLVGHSTSDMTMNVYTHVMDEFKRKEAAKFQLFPQL